MRRSLCLVSLTLVGVMLVVARDEARQPRETIVTQQVTDNLYMLGSDPSGEGMRSGGNTALFETADGVVLVDTKLAGYGADILAEVRKITSKPVTTIINTHTHFDHSGANTEFPDTVDYVSHENIKFHMAREDCQPVTNCDAFKGENAKYLPSTTFSDRMSLFSGPDQIDLYHFGRGHTDGDTFVVFKAARAMHTGDMFLGKFLPFIDAQNENGGSAIEFGRTLTKAIAGIPDVDTIITGHWDTPLAWSDLVDYRGFYTDLVANAREGIAAGRSVDEAAGAYSVPSRYSEFNAPPQSVTTIMQYVYDGR